MRIEPQSRQLLDMIAASGAPSLTALTPEEARQLPARFTELIGPGPEVAAVRDISIAGPAGPLSARAYEPVPDPLGTVVYYHGGGFVFGGLDDFDAVCRSLAISSGARVVCADYRLAPEHPFPAAPDDAFAALQWVAAQHPESPLVVAGDSAGGNLAAVSALRAREAGGPELVLQVLVYPVVDWDLTRPSYAEYADTELVLNKPEMEWFRNHYVPDEAQRTDPYAAPIHMASFEKLPPAYIVIAQHDPLRDEGLEYATKLEAAGVPVTVRHHDDQIHIFFTLPNLLDSADRALAEAGAAIRDAVAARRSVG